MSDRDVIKWAGLYILGLSIFHLWLNISLDRSNITEGSSGDAIMVPSWLFYSNLAVSCLGFISFGRNAIPDFILFLKLRLAADVALSFYFIRLDLGIERIIAEFLFIALFLIAPEFWCLSLLQNRRNDVSETK